jgi:ATP/ADP translocase/HEAT repeat protein
MRIRLADIRSGERRNALGAFLTLFGIMVGHSILETARDSLFLAKLEAARLPFVYLGIAVLALVIFEGRQRRRGSPVRPSRAQLASLLMGAGVVTFSLWILIGRTGEWILYVLYIWSGLLATLLVVRFWVLLGEIFTVTQARRLFATIGAGSILGAITGSFLAQRIVTSAEATELVLAATISFLLAGIPPFLLRPASQERGREERAFPAPAPSPDAAPPPVDGESPPVEIPRVAARAAAPTISTLRAIARHPYVRRVAALVVVSTITLTVADLVFKTAVAREVRPENLGYVFATTYLLLNIAALLVQISLVGWMTRNLAIDRVLAFMPLLLLVVSGGFVWAAFGIGMTAAASGAGTFWAAFAIKGSDGIFRHSLHRTSTEVLYVPLAGEWRARARGLVDVLGQRGGQAIASLAFLAAIGLGAGDATIGVALFLLCAGWLVIAVGLKRHYFDLFRSALDEGTIQTRAEFPEMDLASLETLMAALSSPNDAEVRAALDLLAEKDRIHLAPALILYHPSPKVVVRALELFQQAGRTDHLPLLERLHKNPDEEVRVAALTAMPAVEPDCDLLESALADESPDVRATALVLLLASARRPDDLHPRVQSILDTIIHAGSIEAKRALVRAIRRRAGPRFDGVLRSLATHPVPALRSEVAVAMRETPKIEYFDSLLTMLSQRGCREEARRTLVAIGNPALDRLAEALADESLPRPIRRHLPRTICCFDPVRAARFLLDRLPVDPDGTVRYKILRALGHIRSHHPDVLLDLDVLDRVIEDTLRKILRTIDWGHQLARESIPRPEWNTPVRRLVVELLEHKEEHGIERLFRLFGLRYPREDFRRIHRGLQGDRNSRASSRELLENALPSPIKEVVLGILDDVPDDRRLAAGARLYRPPARTHDDLLKVLLEQNSLHLRCLVAYHVGELGLRDLREDLARLRDSAMEAMRDTFGVALDMLDDPGKEKAFVVPIR